MGSITTTRVERPCRARVYAEHDDVTDAASDLCMLRRGCRALVPAIRDEALEPMREALEAPGAIAVQLHKPQRGATAQLRVRAA